MSAGYSDHTPPPAPPPAGSPPAERFIDVFTQPRRAMDGVAQRPLWSLPFLVIFLLMMLYAAANVHLIVVDEYEGLRALMPAEQSETFEQMVEEVSDPTLSMRFRQGIYSALGVVFFWLLVPATALYGFCRLSEGVGSFHGTLGVIYWAGLIAFGLKTLLGWLVLVISGDVALSYLSLQSLLSERNPMNPLFFVAGLLGDPFFWWMLWVVALGLARVHRIAEQRALVVVLATHGLFSVVLIGITALARWGMMRLTG